MHVIDYILMGIIALLVIGAVVLMRKNKGSHCKGCNGCSAGCTDKNECESHKAAKR